MESEEKRRVEAGKEQLTSHFRILPFWALISKHCVIDFKAQSDTSQINGSPVIKGIVKSRSLM